MLSGKSEVLSRSGVLREQSEARAGKKAMEKRGRKGKRRPGKCKPRKGRAKGLATGSSDLPPGLPGFGKGLGKKGKPWQPGQRFTPRPPARPAYQAESSAPETIEDGTLPPENSAQGGSVYFCEGMRIKRADGRRR